MKLFEDKRSSARQQIDLEMLKPHPMPEDPDYYFYKNQIKYIKDRAGHDRRYAIDSSKIEDELGFKRQYNFNYGLKEAIKWYLYRI